MALVISNKSKNRVDGQFGPKMRVNGTIAFDSSYPTNGESLPVSQIGLQTVDKMFIPSYKGYTFEWDGTNKKVKAYYADYSVNTDGALIEVANAGDLSALTAVPFEAEGDE